ncbi:hypothetical protein GCM10010298_49100 [Streptomyces microflavus]|uniref:Uncharacterized protein n=1 Tax=Streptomyces microflavus TaxID=1919 RepID=A0A7J0CHT3_STRMI|nr:hypothetical protein Smic_06170 [Streptomyces microflavus]GGX77982.1 hypothetical protein GCM10010298_49100 [Streptomyces microflavus]
MGFCRPAPRAGLWIATKGGCGSRLPGSAAEAGHEDAEAGYQQAEAGYEEAGAAPSGGRPVFPSSGPGWGRS